MTGSLIRIIVSFLLSLVTFMAPREEYQSKLDSLPSMAQKADGHNLRGWSYESKTSQAGVMTHYYYSFPCADSTLPVLLMLHGFNTDGRTFGRLSGLASRFRLVAYNFPEQSRHYRGKISDFNAILDDFCSVMGFDTLCLAGNSLGGGIALCYAACSDRVVVRRLLLISSEIFGATEADRRRSRGMAAKLLKYPDYKLYFLLDRSRALIRRLERAGFGEDAPSEILVIRRIDWYRQILKALRDYDGRENIGRITCPVIALHGSKDNVIPLEEARTIEQLLPHAHFEILQGGGHAMAFVQGPEVVERLIALCEQQGWDGVGE